MIRNVVIISIFILLLILINKTKAQCTPSSSGGRFIVECEYGYINMNTEQRVQYLKSKIGTIKSYYNLNYSPNQIVYVNVTQTTQQQSGSKYYVYGTAYYYPNASYVTCGCFQTMSVDTNTTVLLTKAYQIDGCSGFDSNEVRIDDVKCWELGKPNPLKLRLNSPTVNPIWTKLVYTKTRVKTGIQYDSTTYEVVTNGCSGISLNGNPLIKNNAQDTCSVPDTVDGVPRTNCYCFVNGTLLQGTCSENNIDTSCGGVNGFTYGTNNDSIILPCANNDELKDTIPKVNVNDSNALPNGINHLLEGQRQQLDETKKSNGFLSDILRTIGNIFDIIKGVPDTLAHTNQILNDIKNGVYHDTTLTGDSVDTSNIGDGIPDNIIGNDTTNILNNLKDKYGPDTSKSDTIVGFDTTQLRQGFRKFEVDIYNGDCGCSDEWFVLRYRNQEYPVDLCQYETIAQLVKKILKIIAYYTIFLFYRKYVFEIIIDTFRSK